MNEQDIRYLLSDDLVPVVVASLALRVSTQTVRGLIHCGKLDAVIVGYHGTRPRYMVKSESVLRLIGMELEEPVPIGSSS